MSSVVFIDARVAAIDSLLEGLAEDVSVVILDTAQDGVEQITSALGVLSEVSALHIFSHASDGTLFLGATTLEAGNLGHYQTQLAVIGKSLTDAGDIVLYGCNVASGDAGQLFIQNLAALTGADVAASTGLTGGDMAGGDWLLEASTGAIESLSPLDAEAQADYPSTLASVSGVGVASTVFTATSVSGDYRIDALMSGYKWGSGVGTGTTINYSFPSAGAAWGSSYSSKNEPSNVLDFFGEAEKAAAREALAQWANVSNLAFVEVSDSAEAVGDIRFARSSTVQNLGHAHYPNPSARGGDVWINLSYDVTYGSGFQLLLHEIGHALGLKHSFEGANVLPFYEDNRGFTVMAYTQAGYPFASTPQSYDVLAIQYLYGIKGYTGAPLNLDVKVYGGESGDVMASADGNDELYGLGGNDTVSAGGGNDIIYGGVGHNAMDGGAGADTIYGDAGNDTLSGGAGDDYLYGGAGVDRAEYANATSAVTVSLSIFAAQNTGDAGSDTVLLIEDLLGSGFDDTLTGDSGANVLDGAAGNDSLSGGTGNDTIMGGAGVDRADYANAFLAVTVNLSVTTAQNTVGAGNDTLDSIENLLGSRFNDTLTGNTAANTLDGGAGNDTLSGGAGDDILNGGAGADRLAGGIADDTYYVDAQSDLVFEGSGEGLDNIIASTSFYLYDNVENLTLAQGAGNVFGSANASNNTVVGNEGVNLLIGWDGDDTLLGGAGNDILYGVIGADALLGEVGVDVLIGGEGGDTLDGGPDPDHIFGESGSDALYGGTGFATDILVGGAGNDTLDGSASATSGQTRNQGDFDYLYGEDGDDTYYVDTPADLTFEFTGLAGGNDNVIADITGGGFYLYSSVENLTLTGNTPFGVGNELDNTLTGSALTNFLLGGAGNDTINGKGGNDVLFGEGGADIFVFERGTGGDVIGDFEVGVDKMRLVGIGYSSVVEVKSHMVADGAISAIDLGTGAIVVLHNVTIASLSAGDFLLA